MTADASSDKATSPECEAAHGFNALRKSFENASQVKVQPVAQSAFDTHTLDFDQLASLFRDHSGKAVHSFARRHGGRTLPVAYRVTLGEFLDGSIQYRPRSTYLLRAARIDGGNTLALGGGLHYRWAPVRSPDINFDLGVRGVLDLGMSWESRTIQELRGPEAFMVRPELGGSLSVGRNSLLRLEGRLGLIYPLHLRPREGLAWHELAWSPALALLVGDSVELEFAWRMPTELNGGSREAFSLFTEHPYHRLETAVGIRW